MRIKIEFFTYWHCGAGSSGGSRVDALVAKDKEGLPYIPGKTLKGHIREMAESLDDCTFVNICFGGSADENEACYDEKYKEVEAECYFSSAVVEEKIDSDLKSYLYRTISSTKIDEKGIADTGTLREIEVVVPLTLYATIEFREEAKKYEQKMEQALEQVKRMGLNRTRGLGRCSISVVGESND